MTTTPRVRIRLRAAAGLLVLALGWLAVPLSFAAHEPDVCEMECCVAEGRCCCAARHEYVAGEIPQPDEVTFEIETELRSPCPASCAGAATLAQSRAQRAKPATAPLIDFTFRALSPRRSPQLRACTIAIKPSSPRAPPASAVRSA